MCYNGRQTKLTLPEKTRMGIPVNNFAERAITGFSHDPPSPSENESLESLRRLTQVERVFWEANPRRFVSAHIARDSERCYRGDAALAERMEFAGSKRGR